MDKGDVFGYSNGILSLALALIILLLIFHGSTDALIPLYAVVVCLYLRLPLSQSGMIIHCGGSFRTRWVLEALISFVRPYPHVVGGHVVIIGCLAISLIMPIIMYIKFLKINITIRVLRANCLVGVKIHMLCGHHYDVKRPSLSWYQISPK